MSRVRVDFAASTTALSRVQSVSTTTTSSGRFIIAAVSDKGFQVIQKVNPTTLLPRGNYQVAGGNAVRVKSKGSLVYGMYYDLGFHVFDIDNQQLLPAPSTPDAPKLVGTFVPAGVGIKRVLDGAIVDDIAFLLVRGTVLGGIYAVNITNPASMSLIGSALMAPTVPGTGQSLAYLNGRLYMGADTLVQVIDATDSANLTPKGSFPTTASVFGVLPQVMGTDTILFLAAATQGVLTLNATDFLNLALLSTYTETVSTPWKVTSTGNYLYVSDLNTALQVLSTSNLKKLSYAGSYPLSSACNEAAIDGTEVTLAADTGGVVAVTKSRVRPQLANTYVTGGEVGCVTVSGNSVLLRDIAGTPDMQVWDSSGAPTLGFQGSAVLPASNLLSDITVDETGDYAYSSAGPVQIIDIRDQSYPIVVGTYSGTTSAFSTYVINEIALVGAATQGLVRLNVTMKSNPQFLNSYNTVLYAFEVKGRSSYTFVSDPINNKFCAFDTSNVAIPPVLKNCISTPGQVRGVALSDSAEIAYVGAYTAGLLTFDISDPSSLKLINSFSTGRQPTIILQKGNFLYAINQGQGILDVIDISGSLYEIAGTFTGTTSFSRMALKGDNLFIAAFNSLLVLTSTTPIAEPGFTAKSVTICSGQTITVTRSMLGLSLDPRVTESAVLVKFPIVRRSRLQMSLTQGVALSPSPDADNVQYVQYGSIPTEAQLAASPNSNWLQMYSDGTGTPEIGSQIDDSNGKYPPTPVALTITYITSGLTLEQTAVTLPEGGAVVVTQALLAAQIGGVYDPNYIFDFTYPATPHAWYALASDLNTPLTTVTQAVRIAGQLRLVHDNSKNNPAGTIQVRARIGALTTAYQAASMTYVPRIDAPVIVSNTPPALTQKVPSTLRPTATNPNVPDGSADDALVLTVADVTTGCQVAVAGGIATNSSFPRVSLPQRDVTAGALTLVGNTKASCGYSVAWSNGVNSVGPISLTAAVTGVHEAPTLVVDPITCQTDGTGTLSITASGDGTYSDDSMLIVARNVANLLLTLGGAEGSAFSNAYFKAGSQAVGYKCLDAQPTAEFYVIDGPNPDASIVGNAAAIAASVDTKVTGPVRAAINYNYVAPAKSFVDSLPLVLATGAVSFVVFTCCVGNCFRLWQRNDANSPSSLLRARRNGAGELEAHWETLVEPVTLAFFDKFSSTTCMVRSPEEMSVWMYALAEILKEYNHAPGPLKGKRLAILSAFAALGVNEKDSDRQNFIKAVIQEIAKYFPGTELTNEWYSVGPAISSKELKKGAKGIAQNLVSRFDVKVQQNSFAKQLSLPRGGSAGAGSPKGSGGSDFKGAGGEVEMTSVAADGKDSERPLLAGATGSAGHSRESSGGSGSGDRKATDGSQFVKADEFNAVKKIVDRMAEALDTQGLFKRGSPPSSPATPASGPAAGAVPPPPPADDVGVSIMSPSSTNR